MTATETVAAAASSSPKPPARTDLSPSNVSSPLTEVEDKDGDPDDMDVDEPMAGGQSRSEDEDDVSRAAASRPASDNDEDSALSEADPDMNDSEAETERLYDTPVKTKTINNGRAPDSSPELSPSRRLAAHKRERNFQASPSKLKQQLLTDGEAKRANGHNDDEDDEELSDIDVEDEDNEADGEEEAGAENGSHRRRGAAASSAPVKNVADKNKEGKGARDATDKDGAPAMALTRSQRSSSDARKRKRSPTTDPSESDQPLRKRIGPGGNGGVGANRQAGDEDAPLKRQMGKTNGDGHESSHGDKADAADDGEGTSSETFRARRSKRASAKKRGAEEGDEEDVHHEEQDDDAPEDGETGTMEDEGPGLADDEQLDAEVDEEAEAAHRNEEELERKKAAFEQLQTIEKRFTSFRDKLYQERLDQLNQEEAMLLGDNPTHPEYIAMQQCLNERRDEKIRVADLELQLNLQTLRQWAVGRRSQIHGQYFQSVRESRELVLEELGRQWYQIQHQRRRHANTIPDYGLRFPASPAQRIKDAITYNKEVSILAGVAKYEGFPAAPKIRGASAGQVEDDLEAILRARQPEAQPADNPPIRGTNGTLYAENKGTSNVNGGAHSHHHSNTNAHAATNGAAFHALGVAGQQFLSETPWANPTHPAHQSTPVPAPAPLSQHTQHTQHAQHAQHLHHAHAHAHAPHIHHLHAGEPSKREAAAVVS